MATLNFSAIGTVPFGTQSGGYKVLQPHLGGGTARETEPTKVLSREQLQRFVPHPSHELWIHPSVEGEKGRLGQCSVFLISQENIPGLVEDQSGGLHHSLHQGNRELVVEVI
jgi:hypothetical protein